MYDGIDSVLNEQKTFVVIRKKLFYDYLIPQRQLENWVWIALENGICYNSNLS